MAVGERRLGTRAKVLIGLGVVLVSGLAVAVAIYAPPAWRSGQRRAATAELLDRAAAAVRSHLATHPLERFDYGATKASGQGLLGIRWIGKSYGMPDTPDTGFEPFVREDELCDAWGRPILYRSPGPVHARGWDLWSVGPNGIDEQGQGDDLLVGEDVAAVGSG